jgi:uncharacterized membrane protein
MGRGKTVARVARLVASLIGAIFVVAILPPVWVHVIGQWFALLSGMGTISFPGTIYWIVQYLILVIETKRLCRETKDAHTNLAKKRRQLLEVLRQLFRSRMK